MAYLQRYLFKVPPEKQDTGAIAFYAALDHIGKRAPSVTASILQELRDQSSHLKLIASENYCSLAVQLAMGNLLTDKYAEGYPYHRFYAQCENVDVVETEGGEEAKIVFNCQHAYLQPHSGSDANLIAFWAILNHKVQDPELKRLGNKSLDDLSEADFEALRHKLLSQTVLGMSLGSGGHLTHGYRQNISGKMFRAVGYDIDPATGLLDYGKIAALAREVKPLILLAGYSAYSRKINYATMREIADEVGAVLMVDMAHFAGLVAGKLYTGEYDPVAYADVVTSTTHKTLRGPRGGLILCKSEYKDAINKGCPFVMGGPLPNVMAAKVVALKEAGTQEFAKYASNIVDNAQALSEELMRRGIRVLTGGTENHMVLIDVREFGLTGRQCENALNEAYLTVNRNALFRDPNGPWYTSGIRVGTAALTTLGMGPDQLRRVAGLIHDVLSGSKGASGPDGKASRALVSTDSDVLKRVRGGVKELLSDFPLYPELDIEGFSLKGEHHALAN